MIVNFYLFFMNLLSLSLHTEDDVDNDDDGCGFVSLVAVSGREVFSSSSCWSHLSVERERESFGKLSQIFKLPISTFP